MMQISKRRKKYIFTLLEIMVCLAIIGLLGAVMGIKGVELLSYHKFHRSLQTFLFTVQRTSLLAVHQQADVVCKIEKDEKGNFTASFTSDSPFFPSQTLPLEELDRIYLEKRLMKSIEITFFSSGRVSPCEVLELFPKRDKQGPLFLDLRYPMAFHHKPPKASSFIPPYPEKKSKPLS